MHSKRSFTLLELVLVIAIVAILAVVAIPKPVDTQLMRIDLAARKIQSDIRYAQSLATSTQKRTRIDFRESPDNDYSVDIKDNGNWTEAVDPLSQENFTVQLNSGDFEGVEIVTVDFDGGDNLVFDKWGNPYGNDENLENGRVTLAGPKDVDIMVETGTARVYIE